MIRDSESGDYFTDEGSSDSDEDSCTCRAEGRAHKRGCRLSYRNGLSGRTLFLVPSNTGAQANPSALGPEIVKAVISKDVKPKMTAGDYVCIQGRKIGAVPITELHHAKNCAADMILSVSHTLRDKTTSLS